MTLRSINVCLLDGDPNGIRVAQIMMSTFPAVAFLRNKAGEVRRMFPEIEQPGVCILIGEAESGFDRQLAYEPRRICRRQIFVSYAAMGSVSRVA